MQLIKKKSLWRGLCSYFPMVAKLSFYVHACSCRGWPACPEGSVYVTQTARPNVAIGATDLPADIFILSNYGEQSQLIRKMARFRCLF